MRTNKKILSLQWALGIVLLAVLMVSAQSYLLGLKTFGNTPKIYTHYNNYVIFKCAYFHLLDNLNLYQLYLTEQWDLYKYSPTFALFMGSLAYLPDWLGLTLWNGLNALILFYALWNCKYIKGENKFWAVLFVLVELVISMQNAQSNGLIAGLIVQAFNLLESKKMFWGVGLIAFSVFIKIFGVVAFVLVLFYPERFKGIAYSLLWMIVLALFPLMVINFSDLIVQYQNWGIMLKTDLDMSLGISFAGFIAKVFSVDNIKSWVLGFGMLLFLIPLLKFNNYKSGKFRLLYLASLLIWVVIFNHKAESPTYIIAITGIAIWYFALLNTASWSNRLILITTLLLTSVSCTDLFPSFFRADFIEPYALKAIPSICIWFWIVYEKMTFRIRPA